MSKEGIKTYLIIFLATALVWQTYQKVVLKKKLREIKKPVVVEWAI